jgi:parvulin-like peptidyl-prolyl isomerase
VVRAKKRRSAGLRWSGAAAVAAAIGLTVTGCGQSQLGAAALYMSQQRMAGPFSSQRVTSVKLADEVANLNSAYQVLLKKKVSISYKQSAMPREVLTWLMQFATTEQLAVREGIHVSPAQAQAQLALEATRARQSGDTLTEVAVLNGLPPDMLPELGRWFSIQSRVVRKFDLGVAPKTSAAEQRLVTRVRHAQCLAAKSMTIKVNPQYGAFDYSQFTVVPTTSTLAAGSLAARPHASQAPQLTPKC